MDELKYLAKRLESLDQKERQPFLAAATASQANDTAKLINLTFNTHCYSVACNFTDFDELGRRFYLGEHTTLPIGKKINFNFYALDILAQKPLAAMWQGCSPSAPRRERIPCEDIAPTKALHRLGEEWLEHCEYSFENESLPKSACALFENSGDPTGSFTALNALANAMFQLFNHQRGDLLALCACAKPDTIAGHVTLCEKHEDLQLVPGVTNLQEYGKKLVLESWKQPDTAVLPYIDFEGYGNERLNKIPGQFTGYGLLKYVGSAPEIAQLAKLPFQQPEYSTLRLFSPINCDL